MKMVFTLTAAILGAIAATLVCWGGLYLYGTFVLREGSLFDTDPEAANIFFAGWFVLSAVMAGLGGRAGYLAWKRRNVGA